MRPSLPLSVQLLLTFVGLLMGTTAVLTTVAYRSSKASLEAEAHRNVGLATRSREQALTQLFHLRQQRAEGFLTSAESLCSELIEPARRLAWVGDCVRTMVGDFRRSERAIGALLTYRGRRVSRSGRAISAAVPPEGSLARVIRGADGAVEYAMRATRGDTTLALQFDHAEVENLFTDQAGLGRSGEVFLIDYDGQFLTRTLDTPSTLPADRAAEFLENCRSGAEGMVALDYRGIKAIQSFVPIAALGTACAAARIGYDEAQAPAERLRGDLVTRGAWFVVIGAVLSLVAAQWISSPVRRLAVSARKLQDGEFDRPIPLAGPSEVRALGRAFNAMGNNLAEVLAKEQTARREAEDANRSKDEFLATVSHELRTPLTAILGWAQMLRAERLPADRVQHAIEVIERSARAQAQLIDDLLDVTRIVSNRLRIAREPVRLTEIIDAALDAVRPQAAAKRIEIETSLADPAVVLGDARRLEQIVWNLAWNAIKFTPESGHVQRTAHPQGSTSDPYGLRHRCWHLVDLYPARLRMVPAGGRAIAQPVRARFGPGDRPSPGATAWRHRACRKRWGRTRCDIRGDPAATRAGHRGPFGFKGCGAPRAGKQEQAQRSARSRRGRRCRYEGALARDVGKRRSVC